MGRKPTLMYPARKSDRGLRQFFGAQESSSSKWRVRALAQAKLVDHPTNRVGRLYPQVFQWMNPTKIPFITIGI